MSSMEEKSFHRESPIKAVVGESKTIFYVHPGALIQGTYALTARVTGSWKTAGQDSLDWSDFDEETIHCALKFCYDQNYTVPRGSNSSKGVPARQEPEQSSAEHNARSESSLIPPSHMGDAMVLHAKVYSFAHRYLVRDLQHYALVQMKGCFGPFLKEYNRPRSVYLADTIRIIYGCTPRSDATMMDPARYAMRFCRHLP
ncbi:hypothetical protein N7471_010033 [Penicillium samsonianum]|uniref:uncharacterized protein n=1 Tax=Penicillium samsonianum TaxID=1882272 RepID=UPI002547DBB0|nr:uncharacterized protein N7471_010033 [Penicillium samsonianum]KAJ6128816.1 hypothetical protein N7471_010033 [Penicillium samsonianum]